MLSTPNRATRRRSFGKRRGVHRLLCALNRHVQTADDPAMLLESVAATARWALHPTGCVIWLREDPARQNQCIAAWAGSRPPAYLAESNYEVCSQWSASPVAALKDTLLRTALLEAGMSLVTPLIHQGEIIGWLGVGSPERGREYTAEKQCFLEILAYQAAAAIQSMRLKTKLETSLTQLRRAYQQTIQAQENERRQLAESLHDETLQHLADISVRLGLLRSRSEIGPTDLEDLQTRLARADRCLREIARGIHPAILTDLGLIEAVIAFLEALPTNHGPTPLQVELCVTGFKAPRLPDQNLELALYRFMQNGIINALSHGRAGYIRVELEWGLNSVEVKVKDNGCGMNITIEEAARAGHFGLLTMRERIEVLGGKFILSSAPDRGTQVIGCVPVTMRSPAPGEVERYIFDLA